MSRARDVADIQDNAGGAVPPFVAGKNVVINSNFSVWQRGISFATANVLIYTADRWQAGSGATVATLTQQSSGLTNFQYAARHQRTAANTGTNAMFLSYNLETKDSLQFANKTITLSFYARAGANYSGASNVLTAALFSGTGTDQTVLTGFTSPVAVIAQSATLTTSWQRFSFTGTVGSTATQLGMYFAETPIGTAGAADYFEITGVQLESGAIATPYAPNSTTYQGELAACQRYYYRTSTVGLYGFYGVGLGTGTTSGTTQVKLAQTMRVVPTSLDSTTIGNYRFWNSTTSTATTAVGIDTATSTTDLCGLNFNVAAGLVGGSFYMLTSNNNASTYLGFSAEL